jgi:hypothetical protein
MPGMHGIVIFAAWVVFSAVHPTDGELRPPQLNRAARIYTRGTRKQAYDSLEMMLHFGSAF